MFLQKSIKYSNNNRLMQFYIGNVDINWWATQSGNLGSGMLAHFLDLRDGGRIRRRGPDLHTPGLCGFHLPH